MHLCTHVWGYLCAYASVNADVVVRLRYCHNSVCFFFLKVKHGGMSDEAIEIDDSHSTAAILHTIKIRLNQQQQQPQPKQKRTKEEKKKKKKKRRKSHRVFLVCH